MRQETQRCGAKTRQPPFQPCRNPAGPGGRCRKHGGASPQVLAKAKRDLERAEAEKAVRTYGLPVDVDPADALLQEVHRTAGHVAYLGQIVGDLERGELRQWAASGEGGGHWDVSVWVKLYQSERAHLVGVCRAAIAAGIAERQVQLAERQGELVGELLKVAVEAANLTPPQREAAYAAVRGHLARVA